jgi:tetratricopeptide (TPR) repeat protein
MRIDGRAEWDFVEALALLGLDDEIFRIDDEPGDGVLSLLGRHDEAAATALALLDEQPDRFDRIAVAGLTLASAGRIEESAPYLEQAWKGFEGRVASQDGSGQVIALAAARRATGAPLQTAELSAAVRNNAERMREAGMTGVDWSMSADYEAGLAAYLEGDLDRAIELIGKAVDAGFFLPSHENLMPDLYGDDRFAAVVSIHEERRERERRAFLDVVCSDNPYADVWQPLDETCER